MLFTRGAVPKSEQSEAPAQGQPDASVTPDKNADRREFDSLDDTEYEEFLRWLEFRKQKSNSP